MIDKIVLVMTVLAICSGVFDIYIGFLKNYELIVMGTLVIFGGMLVLVTLKNKRR